MSKLVATKLDVACKLGACSEWLKHALLIRPGTSKLCLGSLSTYWDLQIRPVASFACMSKSVRSVL